MRIIAAIAGGKESMCLIVIVWRAHAEYPCFVAANRDEIHERATMPAHWWADRPEILAGRDLVAGGTWIGMTRAGRFAAVTNYRDPLQRRADARSRGSLVTWFLESSTSVPDSIEYLRRVGADYNGFNLIISDGERLGIYESMRGEGRELDPGVYGLSNHFLDTPWPKVNSAKSRLIEALDDSVNETAMLALLRDERPAPDEQLPRTGLSFERERQLSSAFIRTPDYGTRSSTLMRIDRHRQARFDEWSWDRAGAQIGRVSLQFVLQPSGP
jgi:uncharacterized protein with NRDE domain